MIRKSQFLSTTFMLITMTLMCSASPKDRISKFISKDTRAYIEVREGKKLRKLFTEYKEHYMAMLVFDELNNPEVLKISFTDSSNKQNIWTIEFRQQKETPVLGKKLVEKDYIESLSSRAPGFEKWKKRFSSFPNTESSLMQNFVVIVPSNSKSSEIKIVDGANIALSIKGMLCFCKNGGIAAACFISSVRCGLDNLCAAWTCIEDGNWTPECAANLEKAHVCLTGQSP